MWFKIKSYLTFLRNSTNQHGVHSPFIYDLVTKCFYKRTSSIKKKQYSKIKNTLLSNNSVITITDFGKGSKVFKSNKRKVADIARVAGISNKRAHLLIRIVEYFDFQNMLEIGTSVGLGTSALHIGNPEAKTTTLEGCNNTAEIAKELFQKFHIDNIKCVIGDFKETLPLTLKEQFFDFIYFDGNHQKEPTLEYFNKCLNFANNNSVFIFDDINWSIEMQEAWEEIKQHPKVTATINTYYWGFVFFRKEQQKEHFTIRV